jgi:hypothetical protein
MRTTMLAAVLVTALAGCGGSVGGKSPEKTFQMWKSAVSDRSFNDAWEMLSAVSKEQMSVEAKRVAEAAVNPQGPVREQLSQISSFSGLSLDDMKKLDGRTLFVILMKMAAESGRDDWERMTRAEFSRVEEKGDRADVFVRLEGREDSRPMPLIRENGVWKVDLPAVPVQLLKPGDFAPAPTLAPEKPAL